MSKGHIVIDSELLEKGTPEFKGLIDEFIGKGELLSKVTDVGTSKVVYCLDHPDFDSEKYGEHALYDLVVGKKYDGWNKNMVLKALWVYYGDKDRILVKDYTK